MTKKNMKYRILLLLIICDTNHTVSCGYFEVKHASCLALTNKKYCDDISLCRLSCVCKRFNEILYSVWETRSKKLLATNQLDREVQNRSFRLLPVKEKCRISKNWIDGRYKETIYFSCKTRYMPCIHLDKNILWLSRGSLIQGYKRTKNGLNNKAEYSLNNNGVDVCKFIVSHGMLISGGTDGGISVWSSTSGNVLFNQTSCHLSTVNAVDFNGDVLLTGSRDRTLKLWRQSEDREKLDLETQEILEDRIWSLAATSTTCAVGTSAHQKLAPLHLLDLNRMELVTSLEVENKLGAGILDIHWESPETLLTAGYDTNIRLWDLRTGRNVMSWMDPFDSAIYCLASDNVYTIVGGTAFHGRVQLWDKRYNLSMQMYYMSIRHSSPAYSIAFDPCNLYVALDQSVNIMNFAGFNNKMINYNIK